MNTDIGIIAVGVFNSDLLPENLDFIMAAGLPWGGELSETEDIVWLKVAKGATISLESRFPYMRWRKQSATMKFRTPEELPEILTPAFLAISGQGNVYLIGRKEQPSCSVTAVYEVPEPGKQGATEVTIKFEGPVAAPKVAQLDPDNMNSILFG